MLLLDLPPEVLVHVLVRLPDGCHIAPYARTICRAVCTCSTIRILEQAHKDALWRPIACVTPADGPASMHGNTRVALGLSWKAAAKLLFERQRALRWPSGEELNERFRFLVELRAATFCEEVPASQTEALMVPLVLRTEHDGAFYFESMDWPGTPPEWTCDDVQCATLYVRDEKWKRAAVLFGWYIDDADTTSDAIYLSGTCVMDAAAPFFGICTTGAGDLLPPHLCIQTETDDSTSWKHT